MFHIVIWLVVGALIGLVAGLLMRGNEDQGVFVNVLVGVLGALIAGWVVAPYFGLHAGDPKVLKSGRSSLGSSDQLSRALGWFSIGLGITELLMPRRITKELGMEGNEGLVRAYGAREIGSGLLSLSIDNTPWVTLMFPTKSLAVFVNTIVPSPFLVSRPVPVSLLSTVRPWLRFEAVAVPTA